MIDNPVRSPASEKQQALPIHALWSHSEAQSGGASGFDSLLGTLKTRFNVTTAMLSLLGDDGNVAKAFAGTDPLTLDHAAALQACMAATGFETVFVMNTLNTAVQAQDGGRQDIVFYAAAPLVIQAGGKPIGSLGLFGTRPRAFGSEDQLVMASLALAVSAALVMPHNPAAATALALAPKLGTLLLDDEQMVEAVNLRFTELTGLTSDSLLHTGVQQLLCLDRPHSGASLISHALLAEVPACAMTRCNTLQGNTLPVEVFVFQLCDLRQRTLKTVLLIVPLFSGPVESFLLSMRTTERAELLSLHIAGLWAVDAEGRILKLSGAPVAHLDPSTLQDIKGKLLNEAVVFDADQTDWSDFYQSLSQNTLPAEVECCVMHNGHSLWYSMKGFRRTAANGVTTGYHGSFRDITVSKLRELSLRKSEERLSLILKGTNDGAWDWDMETGDYYLSARWWEMMGRTPDKQRAGAEVWMEFIHPDDRDGVRAAFSNAVARGRDTFQSDFRLQHLDGHYISVLGRGHVLRNAQGKPIRTSGTNVDLTEQRLAQSQIRLLQSCVESLQDMVIVTLASPGNSPGPMIAYVNPAFEAFTGFSRDEVMGKSPRMLQGPLTSREALEKIADALHHWQPVKVELVNYKKNGELFWAELQLTPVQADGSDRFTHWIGVQRDITQRKQTEQTLHATSERLTLALEASGLGVWTQHVATRVNYRDKHWYAMLGYPPSDEPVSSTDWLSYVHPDDVARIQVQETGVLASGGSTFEHEFRMRHSSGRWVWINSRGRVIERDEAGQPLVIAGTHMDITDRVEARLATERLRGQGDSK